METLRTHNDILSADQALKYAICPTSLEIAITLRKFVDAVKMILIGPELVGNGIATARMLASKAHIVMIINPSINPLANDLSKEKDIKKSLAAIGIVLVDAQHADKTFFLPIVEKRVLSGLEPGTSLNTMTSEERAQLLDKRLDSANKFPSLPDTQRKVAALDDLAPPKKWAEAIDTDTPTRIVILRILNSARYGFRSRIDTIDQAVSLASTKTIREIVTACQIRQLFSKIDKNIIEQYWRHSLAVGFYAKLLSIPADPNIQEGHQKTEFDRYNLEPEMIEVLKSLQLWDQFTLEEQDEPFTAGLLHDVGKIAMLMCLEDSFELISGLIASEVEQANSEKQLWAHSVIDIERFLMKDIDHQVIGSRLAEKWELDPSIQQVITQHHDLQEQTLDLIKLVALANVAANTLFPYPATEEQHPLARLFSRLTVAVQRSPNTDMNQAAMEAINEEIYEDLVDVLKRLNISPQLWQIVDLKKFFHMCYVLGPKIRHAVLNFL